MRHPYIISTIGCLAVCAILLIAEAYDSKDLVKRGGVIIIIVALCMLYREVFVERRSGKLRKLVDLARTAGAHTKGGSIDPLTRAMESAATIVDQSANEELKALEIGRSGLVTVHSTFAIIGEVLHGFGDLIFLWTQPWNQYANRIVKALFTFMGG